MQAQRNAESVTVTGETARVTFCPRSIQISTTHYSGGVPVWSLSGDYPAILAAVVAGQDIHPLLDCVLEMELPSRLLRNLVESLSAQLVG